MRIRHGGPNDARMASIPNLDRFQAQLSDWALALGGIEIPVASAIPLSSEMSFAEGRSENGTDENPDTTFLERANDAFPNDRFVGLLLRRCRDVVLQGHER